MNRIVLNVATSYARFAISIGAVAIVTPAIIEGIGLEAYGIWAIVLATVSLLGLADFGLATSAVKFVAECSGAGDIERRNRLVTALFSVYSLVACVLLLGTGAAVALGAGEAVLTDNRGGALLLLLSGCTAAVGLYLSLFRAVLAGAGLMYLANAAEIAMTCLYAVLTLAAIDRGVPGLAGAFLIATATGTIAMLLVAWLRIPRFRVGFSFRAAAGSGVILRFSIWAFVANAATLAMLRIDPFVIGAFLPLTAVAIYSVAARIAEYTLLLNKQFSNALMPLVSNAHGQGNSELVAKILLKGSRYLLLLALPLVAFIGLYAEAIVVAWLGEDLRAAGTPLRILLVAVAASALQFNAANVLGMTGRHRFVAVTLIGSLGCKLFLTLLLLPHLGLVAASLGTLIAASLVEAGTILPAACRHAQVRARDFLGTALPPGLMLAGLVGATGSLLLGVSTPIGLVDLAWHAGLIALVSMPALLIIGLTRDERAALFALVQRQESQATGTVA